MHLSNFCYSFIIIFLIQLRNIAMLNISQISIFRAGFFWKLNEIKFSRISRQIVLLRSDFEGLIRNHQKLPKSKDKELMYYIEV